MKRIGIAIVATGFAVTGCAAGTTTPATKTITSYVTAPNDATSARATEPAPTGPATGMSSDGTYVIGVDIQPGIYRSAGTAREGSDCYWKRLSSLDTSDIIDNNSSPGPQTVEIKATDKAFVSSRCQPWTKVG